MENGEWRMENGEWRRAGIVSLDLKFDHLGHEGLHRKELCERLKNSDKLLAGGVIAPYVPISFLKEDLIWLGFVN
jgi:hypothetical protein